MNMKIYDYHSTCRMMMMMMSDYRMPRIWMNGTTTTTMKNRMNKMNTTNKKMSRSLISFSFLAVVLANHAIAEVAVPPYW